MKEEESDGGAQKSDRWCLVWLWPHKVSVGSGRHKYQIAKKKKRKRARRDWKGIKNQKVGWPSLTLKPCCLCPLSFWLDLSLPGWRYPLTISFLFCFLMPLSLSHWMWFSLFLSISVSSFPNRPDVFKRDGPKTVGSIKIFLNGAQVCHWNWSPRVKVDGNLRDKAR